VHNEALAEILIEGHNPCALQKLETPDLDALRQKMHSRETVQAYVVGRIVLSGRGVWMLTDRAAYVRDPALRGVRRVLLDQVQGFEAERGRFGHSVRLFTEEGDFSMYGVDRELAQIMHGALVARGLASQFDERVTRNHVWRTPAPAGWAQDCVRDAQRRLSAA
jgi:hypothetical protein